MPQVRGRGTCLERVPLVGALMSSTFIIADAFAATGTSSPVGVLPHVWQERWAAEAVAEGEGAAWTEQLEMPLPVTVTSDAQLPGVRGGHGDGVSYLLFD